MTIHERNSPMPGQTFVYVTYIRTTPEKLWGGADQPGVQPAILVRLAPAIRLDPGAPPGSWCFPTAASATAARSSRSSGRSGWSSSGATSSAPELKADGYTRCTFDIEPQDESVKLTVTHVADRPHRLIDAVAGGWPKVLSSLKSLLETGTPLPTMQDPKCPGASARVEAAAEGLRQAAAPAAGTAGARCRRSDPGNGREGDAGNIHGGRRCRGHHRHDRAAAQ
jgi:hypothetical protein